MRLFFNSLSSKKGFVLPENGVRVIIITGQSNADGRGVNADAIPTELAINTDVKVYTLYADYGGSVGNYRFIDLDVEQNNMQINPIHAPFDFHGVELGLGANFTSYFPNEKLYIIKKAIGGTGIIESLPGGSVYETLWNTYTKNAINDLITQGKRPFVYYYFHQGETDANDTDYPFYSDRLDSLISQWRSNLGTELPFMFAEILEFGTSGTKEAEINQQFQDRADVSKHIEVVQATDLTNVGDSQHYDYEAQKAISERLLTKMQLLIPLEITSLIP